PDPGEAQRLLDGLLESIELLLSGHRIHGDLSSYNILAWQGRPYIIDFAQAGDLRHGDDARPLLVRDGVHVAEALAPFGARVEARAVADRMWWSYLGQLA
ncbi:MAG: hypothetical protein HGA19_00265, partial [Oscillochloris sp.]|nr:hypothetical protein [Oscillochloris sp.]